MKTAIAVWNNRIAPVFDVARRVIIVESDTAPGARPTTVLLSGDQPLQKVRQLSALGAESLVCGAISRAFQAALTAGGIRVIPFIAGDVQEVIDAWRGPLFEVDAFAMPGRCRRNHQMTGDGQPKEDRMGNKLSGGGRRPGGRGQGGKGRCRQDPQQPDQSAAAGKGACVCTQCGHSEPHERGNPCLQRKCPQCGASMSRK